MSSNLNSYRTRRDAFLSELTSVLSADERFVAGWLTGSLGKNEADSVSDIDLSLVVLEPHSKRLCMRENQVGAKTSLERYSLFTQFGKPALIHENNNNAPEGGTMTFVLYKNSALMVDWVLIPQSKAKRPSQSMLLFDKVGILVSSPPEPDELEESKKSVAEEWAFFWMMMAITIKYIIREDGVFVNQWFENLYKIKQDIERRLNTEPWKYHRGSISQLQLTREKQIESIRDLCDQMLELKIKVSEFMGSEPLTPETEIKSLLSLGSNRQIESL